MRSAECWEDGFARLKPSRVRERVPMRVPFLNKEEWLRDKTGSRTVVVVGIVDPVRVELDLAVVELEVRRLREVAIGIRNFAFVRPCHQTSSFTSRWQRNYMLSILNLIRRYPVREPVLNKSKQYLLNATHSWKPWSPRLRLFISWWESSATAILKRPCISLCSMLLYPKIR